MGLAAGALVVSACGGSDDADSGDDAAASSASASDPASSESPTSDAPSTDGPGDAIQENRPVTVEGDPLAPFDGSLPEDPAVGVAAPVVSGASFDGTPITIGAPTDNATLAVFLAHWCPHCNDEVPELLSLEESGDMPEGLDVVGISTAVDPNGPNYPPSEWVVDKGWTWPTMADDEEVTAMTAAGGTSFPFLVVLDADGNVLARRAGSASAADTLAFLEDALGS